MNRPWSQCGVNVLRINSEVFGTGMMANEFRQSTVNSCLFFCSGASNSLAVEPAYFDREKKILTKVLDENKNKRKVIYFSSVLATDQMAPYYTHKLNMENLIKEKCTNFAIVKLPQVVGFSKNNTLVNYLIRAMLSEKMVYVQKQATRNLIGIRDIRRLLELIYENRELTSCTLASKTSYTILKVIKILENIINIKCNYKIVSGGMSQDIDKGIILQAVHKDDVVFQSDYVERILTDYWSEFKDKFISETQGITK